MRTHDISPQEIRERVIFFLLLMASEECMAACQEFYPQEKLAYELCRIWFDEIYTPGLSYIDDSLKGDYSEEKVRQFEDAFEVEEIIELERFHRFFELRIEMLQAKHKSAVRFPENDLWRHLVKHASYVLEALAPGSQKLKDAFGKKMCAEIRGRKGLLTTSGWQDIFRNEAASTKK